MGGFAYSSDVSSTCDSRDSMPDRNCSREREIWPSWLLEGRLRERARWRSSRESLIWSAKRNNWGGLVAMAAAVVVVLMVMIVVVGGWLVVAGCTGCGATGTSKGRQCWRVI